MSLPKPYYQDGAVTLYHGDCRFLIPQLGRFALLLTDPPYGIGGGSGTIGKQRAHKHDYLSFNDTLEDIEIEIVPAIKAALRVCDRGIVTPGPKAFHLYPQCIAFGSLFQPATCALNKWGRANSQPILYYGSPPRIGIDIGDTTYEIVSAQSDGAEDHPCPKPIGVWKRLLQLGTNEGETVLDPFAGSGTTGRACKDLGRKCVLIEREERYCEIAARRMGQEVLPLEIGA